MREQCEGVNLTFPMTIPALDPKPLKYSSSSLRTFTGKIKKGSQKFHALLTREDDFLDETMESYTPQLAHHQTTSEECIQAHQLETPGCREKGQNPKFLTKKNIFNTQIERAYPDQKPDWYTDPYCHT